VVGVLALKSLRPGALFIASAGIHTKFAAYRSLLRSVTIYTCARCGRRGSPTGGRDKFAKLHSLLNTDNPELVAKRAVRFHWIASVEQSHEIGERIPLLQLFALAVRARRREVDRLTHASKSMPWAPPGLSEQHGCTRRCRSDVATDRRPLDAKWRISQLPIGDTT